MVLEAVLTKWGFNCITVNDGEQVCDTIKKHQDIRLLLLDWEMPKLSGIDLCHKIRKKEQQYYIILLTSRVASEDMVTGLNAGADDYISKPFKNEELQARLMVGVRMVKLQNQLELIRNKLHKQATRDELTGLLNRRAILEHLTLKMEETKREKAELCLCMCDIDNFKRINDTYGHPTGDLVIKAVTKAITKTLRPYDRVGRFGGEEFLLVIHAKKETSHALIERIRHNVEKLIVNEKAKAISVTLSLGYTFYNDKLKTSESFISIADEALYKAKDAGRNCVEFLKN